MSIQHSVFASLCAISVCLPSVTHAEDQRPTIQVSPFDFVDLGPMLDPVPTNPTVGSEVRRGVDAAVQCYSGIGHIDLASSHQKISGLNDCIRMARMINLAGNSRSTKPFELGLYLGTFSYLSGVMTIEALSDPKGDVGQYAQSYYYQYSFGRTLLRLTDEEVANSASVAPRFMLARLTDWAARQTQTLVLK